MPLGSVAKQRIQPLTRQFRRCQFRYPPTTTFKTRCPLNVDSSRPVSANSGHPPTSAGEWVNDPKPKFLVTGGVGFTRNGGPSKKRSFDFGPSGLVRAVVHEAREAADLYCHIVAPAVDAGFAGLIRLDHNKPTSAMTVHARGARPDDGGGQSGRDARS